MKHWRTNLVFILFLVVGVALGSRLFFLQVSNHGLYKALAQGQHISSSFAKGIRGDIFVRDKEGNLTLLATNREVPYIFVSPAEIEDRQEVVRVLKEVVNEEETILSAVQKENSLYEVIKKNVTEKQAEYVREAKIKGLYVGFETVRFYPQGPLASHVLGFVNKDGIGQYGIEGYYDKVLSGKEGVEKKVRNPAVYLLAAFGDTVQDGSDIILTLDYNIQSMAEALLAEAQKNLEAQSGTIIVLDPRSGKILALANTPAFDPNAYAKISDLGVFQNSAVEKIFEPGSVFKPITMASAINEGAITPETTYEDKGVLRIGGYKILNYDERVWGERSMKEVLQFSINTGAVFAKDKLGDNRFVEYLKKFGIFEPTNIDLAGEVYSQNKELKQGYAITYATASFGQGIEMTPLQLVRAYTALANKGTMVHPYLVEQGSEQESFQVISPQSALSTTAMLVSVTQDGFAKSARVPGYHIAGKTGTAQISWSALGVEKSGYSDQTVQSFIGYAPAYDPRFLVLVKLDNPQTKTAEYSAVPVFQKIAKYLIDYLEIPPDYE